MMAERSAASLSRQALRPRAVAAVGLVDSEAAILRATLTYSLGLLAYGCVRTCALSYVT